MSLIFGVADKLSERVVVALQQMYGGTAGLPHERHSLKAEGMAGFGHMLTYNTPEALFEKQPVYLPEQQLLITSEARLDNREALARQLSLRLHPKLTDGELIQAAYLKWGKESPKYLHGDWSFAVYNYREQELFLARDQHGYTAIYYYHDGHRLVFSSSSKSIFALEGFRKQINMRHFLDTLLIWHQEERNTQAYENLSLVPPAHTLSFKNGKATLSRYWFPEHIQERNYKNPDDYAEELREIFKEAVRVRLRSHKPVASMLSGGLDSGSVSTMAAHLLKQEGKRLTTFSHVPRFKNALPLKPGSRRLLDESPHILAAAAHAGNIDSILLDSAHVSPIDGFIRAIDAFDSVFHAASNAFWLVDLPHQVFQRGFGTLLSGEMGNGTISYSGVNYLLPWYHAGVIRSPKRLVKNVVRIGLMKYFPAWFESLLGWKIKYIKNGYVKENVLQNWGVYEDISNLKSGSFPYYQNAKEGILHILDPGGNPRCQFGNNKTNAFGLEYRDPTGDVNVIEYCLSIPNHAFFDKNLTPRMILKKMMKGLMPDEVLFSPKKGLQASDILYRLQQYDKHVDELLLALNTSTAVKEIFDVAKLTSNWQHFRVSSAIEPIEIQTFVKSLMFGYFVKIQG